MNTFDIESDVELYLLLKLYKYKCEDKVLVFIIPDEEKDISFINNYLINKFNENVVITKYNEDNYIIVINVVDSIVNYNISLKLLLKSDGTLKKSVYKTVLHYFINEYGTITDNIKKISDEILILEIHSFPLILESYLELIKYYVNTYCIIDVDNNNSFMANVKIRFTGINVLECLNSVYCDMSEFNNYLIDLESTKYYQYKMILCELNNSLSIPNIKYTSDCNISFKHFSDVGCDLSIVKLLNVNEDLMIYKYDTGVAFQFPPNIYGEIVVRSKMANTGWSLTNSVGIIDSSYTGNVIVALQKKNYTVKDIELPCSCMQILFKQKIYIHLQQIDKIQKTTRSDSGGITSDLSSDKNKKKINYI